MVTIRPFKALRPAVGLAKQVAALPYDVYSKAEAREKVKGDTLSFLRIDRPETQFEADCDMYAGRVYQKADAMLREMEKQGIFVQDEKACYYLYELVMDGRSQTGLVACSAVDDYLDGTIRKHENTRKEKEEDRVRHVDVCSAQTGPIFLAYRRNEEVSRILDKIKKDEPVVGFTADDGVTHRVWVVGDDRDIAALTAAFSGVSHTYIADGHHRAASAVRVSQMRRSAYPDYTGEEEFNYFLSVLFADEELMIMDYNRVLKTTNGHTKQVLLDRMRSICEVEPAEEKDIRPGRKGEMGFYIQGEWYRLRAKEAYCRQDPVGALDVAFLQREILEPVFGICDPKTDPDIDFVGGIRGLKELERRCSSDCVCAFAMYPTSIRELFEVADAGLLMPPKSTWFEPKLRSGLFIHKIER